MLDFKTKNFFKIKTKMNNKIHLITINSKKVKIKQSPNFNIKKNKI